MKQIALWCVHGSASYYPGRIGGHVLQNWIEKDLLIKKYIDANDNCADAMTKPMRKQLHY